MESQCKTGRYDSFLSTICCNSWGGRLLIWPMWMVLAQVRYRVRSRIAGSWTSPRGPWSGSGFPRAVGEPQGLPTAIPDFSAPMT